jgi:hypothetical protein
MSMTNSSNEKTWHGIKIGSMCAAACAAGALAVVSQAWASTPAQTTRSEMIAHISTQCYPAQATATKMLNAIAPGTDKTVVGIKWMGRDALPVIYEQVVQGGDAKLDACTKLYQSANAQTLRFWGTGVAHSGMK